MLDLSKEELQTLQSLLQEADFLIRMDVLVAPCDQDKIKILDKISDQLQQELDKDA